MRSRLRQSDKLSFVFYEDTNFPRYYEIQKKMFKFFLYGLPSLALFGIFGMLALGVFLKEQGATLADRLDQEEGAALVKQNKKQQELIDDLQNRLTKSPTKGTSLPLFLPVRGQKDLTEEFQRLMTVEKATVSLQKDKIRIRFNLVNLAKDNTRIAGIIHVIMKINDKILIWPGKEGPPGPDLQIPFNSGEPFSALRFRPVSADFPPLPQGTLAHFWLISHKFNGDLQLKTVISKTLE